MIRTSKSARREFISIIRDLDPCSDTAYVLEVPSLSEGYDGVGLAKLSMKWWWLKHFTHPETFKQMQRAADGVADAFAELAKATGQVPPRRLVEFVTHHVLNGFYPEIEQVVEASRTDDSRHIARARAALRSNLEGRWQERS